jgi:hypothetical protein
MNLFKQTGVVNMRKLLFMGLFLLPFSVLAQLVAGVKAGLVTSNYIKNEFFQEQPIGMSPEFGLFLRGESDFAFAQVEMNYSLRRADFKPAYATVDTLFTYAYSAITIPLQMGYRFWDYFGYATGPVFGLIVKEEVSWKPGGVDEGLDDLYGPFLIEFSNSLMFNHDFFSLGVSFNLNMTDWFSQKLSYNISSVEAIKRSQRAYIMFFGAFNLLHD